MYNVHVCNYMNMYMYIYIYIYIHTSSVGSAGSKMVHTSCAPRNDKYYTKHGTTTTTTTTTTITTTTTTTTKVIIIIIIMIAPCGFVSSKFSIVVVRPQTRNFWPGKRPMSSWSRSGLPPYTGSLRRSERTAPQRAIGCGICFGYRGSKTL